MRYFTAVVLLLIFGFNGCTGGTPSCTDEETKSLVIRIAKDELRRYGMSKLVSSSNFEVASIRTKRHNKDLDSYSCAADLKIVGVKNTLPVPITYNVESIDNGDNYRVEIFGLK
ncbi:MAG: hypothetical protein DRG11_05860 [Epsilonproteobacteria bacterium]|nr:MAG: hypothetical protein DRG11_05860 [Campylobacterota bacterium]